MTKSETAQLNPLVLAYMGDGVLSYRVRRYLIERHDAKAGRLHLMTKAFVSAKAQAEIFDELKDGFSVEEADIARRARNAHNTTKAKNAGLAEYKKATALEAVLGYLSLSEDNERLEEILCFVLDAGENLLKGRQN